jgi:hypothetical protein
MFKGLFLIALLVASAVFAISKGYHNNIAEFGEKAKPIADYAVDKVEKSIEGTKEVTKKVTTEVKERVN